MSVYGTYDLAARINNQQVYSSTSMGGQYSQRVVQEQPLINVSKTTGNTCTDGVDDGKIGFGEGLASFAKGLIKPFTEAIKHPIKTALAVAGCAALTIATGGAATPFLIAGGLGIGAFQVGKGLYGCATAKTDAEKKDSLENLGSGTTTIVGSVAGAKAYAKNVTGQSQSIIDSLKIVKDGLKFNKPTPPPVSATPSNQQSTSSGGSKPSNPQLEAPKSNSSSGANGGASNPRLEAPKTNSSSGANGGTSTSNGATAANTGANSGAAPQVKWDVDTIKAAFQNAKAKGADASQIKKLYRTIIKEIHPDKLQFEYQDAGLLMSTLQDCYAACTV